MNIIALIFSQYFYLRQTIPLFLYAFYTQFREVRHPIIEGIMKTGVLAIGLGTSYTILGYILKIPLKNLISFTWAYPSPITWGIFFLIFYYILIRKEENNLTSFTLATLATVGGGWLYEVPFFHPIGMFLGKGSFFYNNVQMICILLVLFELRKKKKKSFKSFSPNPVIYVILLSSIFSIWFSFLYPNAQIICLLLLAYELRKRNFKINKLIVSTALLYLAFSIPLFLDIHGFWCAVRDILGSLENLVWSYRIPASLFLLSLLSGIDKQSEMMKNV